MEGKAAQYSISVRRNNKKEKKYGKKRDYYKKNNQEKLAEKARERMKQLREKRATQGEANMKDPRGPATRGSSKVRNSGGKKSGPSLC